MPLCSIRVHWSAQPTLSWRSPTSRRIMTTQFALSSCRVRQPFLMPPRAAPPANPPRSAGFALHQASRGRPTIARPRSRASCARSILRLACIASALAVPAMLPCGARLIRTDSKLNRAEPIPMRSRRPEAARSERTFRSAYKRAICHRLAQFLWGDFHDLTETDSVALLQRQPWNTS